MDSDLDILRQIDSKYLKELKVKADEEAQTILKDPEEDPKRINFHRLLLNAAQRGQSERAEEIIGQMEDSGYDPGPRAFHVLFFSYVKAKQAKKALDVARALQSEGLKLIPETYSLLTYALLNPDFEDKGGSGREGEGGEVAEGETTEDDLQVLNSLLDAMRKQEGPKGTQPAWIVACKELFRKGRDEEAMALVLRGYSDGCQPDSDLYMNIITELSAAGYRAKALKELSSMERSGFTPEPRHYGPIVEAVAASGDIDSARQVGANEV